MNMKPNYKPLLIKGAKLISNENEMDVYKLEDGTIVTIGKTFYNVKWTDGQEIERYYE